MKRIIYFITLVVLLMSSFAKAESFETSAYYSSFMELPEKQRTEEKKKEFQEMYVIEQKVKNIPFRLGDTMDTYLTKRASIPIAEDLGWQVRKKGDGYEAERTLLLEGIHYFHYTWLVKSSGEIVPMNERTVKLHEMAAKVNPRQTK